MIKKDNELEKLKPKIIKILKDNGVKKAGIFGSYAKGEQKKNSDIGILIDLPKGMSLFDVVGVELKLEDALNKKIDDLQKIKLEKAKITRKLPRDRDPRELRLEQEFRTTQNLLAKALKNPSLLLGKFRVKKRSAGKTKIEQNARDEVQRILARIDGALEKPLNELLQVNQDLLNLEKTPLETGKKISKAVSMPKQSTLESAKLQQEKTQVEKELREERVPVIKKTEELLAIDQKLAELN